MMNLKTAASRTGALLLLVLALAGVSAAAPKSPSVPAAKRSAAAYPRTAPPLHSVSGLRRYIARLKQWGREHKAPVKTGYLEAYLYRLQHLAFPNDTVDWNRYVGALDARDRLPASHIGAVRPHGARSTQAAGPVNWEYVGPNALSVPYRIYYGQGALSGRVNDLEYDPSVAGTYWVAAAGGGVWKSVDSGQTWAFLSSGWPALETSCVTVHPANGNIAYVGTGDFHGIGGYYGFGIMKTTDGGQTWANLGNAQFGDMSVSEIVVDPENPSIVVAATGRGRGGEGKVWRSTDGGATWTAVIATLRNWTGLSVGALNGGARYYWAVGNGGASEVWRSADRGATWSKVGPILAGGYYAGLGIAASRLHPDTAYLISGPDRRIFKTTNAGAAWADITAGFPDDDSPGDDYNWSQSWYDWHITTSVNGAQDVVYVGLIDLAVSPNGGATWQSAGSTYRFGALTHNDQHCLAVNPGNPNEVLVGNDGGVYRMTYTPGTGAVAFNTTLNAGLGITQFYEADFHPTDPTRMLGGTQDNATPVALGDLGAWRNVCGGDGCGCAINPINPNIQYASAQFQFICRTSDQWTTYSDITPDWGDDDVPFIGRLTLDPSNPALMYAGTNYLWRWDNAAGSWTPRLGATDLAAGNSTITAIAVAPSSSSVLYTGSGSGDVFRSSNAGATWTRINTGTPALPGRAVMSIAVHPTNPNSILVGLSGTGAAHLWRCVDTSQGSRVWTNVAAGLPDVPVNAVVIDPVDPAARFYVGTDAGVFTTLNGGVTWANATAPRGLPNVIVNELKLMPGTGYLMAATYGRGIWRLEAAPAELTVVSPNGGEVWAAGSTRSIDWSSAGVSGNVKLEYSPDNGENWALIAESTPNDGSEPWVLPTQLTSLGRVRVTSLSDGSLTDTSDAVFAIADISLAVTAPNGGESWAPGSAQVITWSSVNVTGSVKLDYSNDGGSNWSAIVASAANDGAHSWTVPNGLTNQGRVRVTSVADPSVADVSDGPFTIPLPTVTVSSPNGGELWAPAGARTITWSSTDLSGNVKLEYSLNGGGSWTTISDSTPNDGAHDWTVPNVAASDALVRVTSVSIPAVTDVSDDAFIIGAASINVTSPNGGEVWGAGSSRNITWTSTHVAGAVKLEYSLDNGASWVLIAANSPGDGVEPWTVPVAPSTAALVRVSSVNEPTATDVSNAVFTISVPAITVLSPNGGEAWDVGSFQAITWTSVSVPGAVRLEYSLDLGVTWTLIAASAANDGSEPWSLPTTPSANALVRVSAIDGSASDVSDGAFTIRYLGGSLKVGASLAFGVVKPGKSRRKSLKITNNSRTQDLVVSVGAPGGPFQPTGATGPFIIRPRRSLSIPFSFSPPARGAYTTALTINSSDPARPTATITATGKGK